MISKKLNCGCPQFVIMQFYKNFIHPLKLTWGAWCLESIEEGWAYSGWRCLGCLHLPPECLALSPGSTSNCSFLGSHTLRSSKWRLEHPGGRLPFGSSLLSLSRSSCRCCRHLGNESVEISLRLIVSRCHLPCHRHCFIVPFTKI